MKAFDDAAGQVSGAWKVGRLPANEPGFLIYVMVDSVAVTLKRVVAMAEALV